MSEEPVLKLVLQRPDAPDCTIAALAMLTGSSYEHVLATAARLAPKVELEGLFLHQIEKVADELGVPLKRKRSKHFDMDMETGILHVFEIKTGRYHVVILTEGRIIETDGTLWHVDTYLATKRFKPGALLVRE